MLLWHADGIFLFESMLQPFFGTICLSPQLSILTAAVMQHPDQLV